MSKILETNRYQLETIEFEKDSTVFDYKFLLKQSIEKKMKANPQLSLRAFALKSDLSVASLSRFLSGSRQLTADGALKIARALGWTSEEAEHLMDLVALERSKNDREKRKILSRLMRSKRTTMTMSLDIFRLMSDWYHAAIISLVNTKGFRSNTIWIADRLQIETKKAKAAIEVLLSTGAIKKNGHGELETSKMRRETPPDVADVAIRENHQQHLERASSALQDVPVELREFINLTFNMNLSDLEKAKNLLRQFVDRFESEIEKVPSEEVFHLNIQLYPVTKIKKGP